MSGERIQKVLADAGLASRRAIETMVAEGRIKVNGDAATAGQKVVAGDRITIDGRMVRHSYAKEATRVLLYKKRVGELVTRDDPEGRKTVFKKLPKLDNGRWIAVGRLDLNTSGLLLMTNDGELARRLTHPSYEMEREYAVRVLGTITKETLDKLRKGVELEDGPAHFDKIEPGERIAPELDDDGDDEGRTGSANTWWKVTLKEGRNREVRRLFDSQDLKVSRLIRVRYGPILLGRGVKSSGFRDLDRDELSALRAAVGFEAPKKAKEPRERRSRPGAEERKIGDVPRRDAIKKVDRKAKPEGWTGYKPRKPE
ncbi:pseudouridine synthase [Nevskia sp.]|uniref:pseudouridine synthase n=1 Tax=Nevskia sp. TaxID=1929292 RepID=UPI0025DF7479|nr:pseudouridine synthase [Nevskia sp.]